MVAASMKRGYGGSEKSLPLLCSFEKRIGKRPASGQNRICRGYRHCSSEDGCDLAPKYDAVAATMTYDGKPKGKVLIATVAGDIHDIGKSIVASTMRGCGIEVIDLGREVSVEEIIRQAEKHQVDIIATSALLTSTLKEQRKPEQALDDAGLKGVYKTMVGGAPCTMRWARRIGATAYSEDVIDACEKALALLKQKE